LGVMALYRPYGRHGPWVAQMGSGSAFVLDPELERPSGSPRDVWLDRPPPMSDREPDSQGGT
jgi:hypothetical protein